MDVVYLHPVAPIGFKRIHEHLTDAGRISFRFNLTLSEVFCKLVMETIRFRPVLRLIVSSIGVYSLP